MTSTRDDPKIRPWTDLVVGDWVRTTVGPAFVESVGPLGFVCRPEKHNRMGLSHNMKES